MQANAGSTSFDPSNPESSIKQMIEEGVQGTTEGPGIVQYMGTDPTYAYTNNRWPNNPFTAARCYNSGSINTNGDLDDAAYGTKSYTNDIANRLIGWDGLNTGCIQAQCGLAEKWQHC